MTYGLEYVIGVDIGTQSTKAILVRLDGKIITTASKGYIVETPKPMWAQQWPDVWLDAVLETIKTCVKTANVDSQSIKAVCVSSLYGGSGIPVNDKIEAIHPCLIWMDRRAMAEVQWIKDTVDTKKLFEITGNSVDSYYGYTKILWLKNNEPKIWANTRYLIPPNSFVNFHLTGKLAVDHSSAGNIGGVYDIKNRTWSKEAMEMLGIDPKIMPERLIASDDIVGDLLPNIAADLGLSPTTKIVAGGVDCVVATYAAGVVEAGDHVAMMGTSMCWGYLNKDVDAKHGLISMPNVINAMTDHYVFGGAIAAGASITWFKEQFCQEEIQQAHAQDIDVHELLEQQARQILPGSEGILYLPYLMGERSPIWDPMATGLFMGLTLYHKKAHLYRAVLEGIAFALNHNIECGKAGARLLKNRLIVVGGAAKSPLWLQIIADVTGFPVWIIEEEVEAPLGDAGLAALAVGLIKDPAEIRQWSHLKEVAQPVPKNHLHYQKIFDQYKDIYLNINVNMHALKSISDSINI